jgi:hypothetical protein
MLLVQRALDLTVFPGVFRGHVARGMSCARQPERFMCICTIYVLCCLLSGQHLHEPSHPIKKDHRLESVPTNISKKSDNSWHDPL